MKKIALGFLMLLLRQDSVYACEYPGDEWSYDLVDLTGPTDSTDEVVATQRAELGERATLFGDGKRGVQSLVLEANGRESIVFEVKE